MTRQTSVRQLREFYLLESAVLFQRENNIDLYRVGALYEGILLCFSTVRRDRCNQSSAISEDDFDVKKCPLPSTMLFQVWKPGKGWAEGPTPHQNRMKAVFVNCFHRSIFKAWSHLWAEKSQLCQVKMGREWAPMRLFQRERWAHVCSSCYPLV